MTDELVSRMPDKRSPITNGGWLLLFAVEDEKRRKIHHMYFR